MRKALFSPRVESVTFERSRNSCPVPGSASSLQRDIRICVFTFPYSDAVSLRKGWAHSAPAASRLQSGAHCDIARLHESRRSAGITARVLRSRVGDDRSLARVSISDYGQSRDMKAPFPSSTGNPLVMQSPSPSPSHPRSRFPEENPWKFLVLARVRLRRSLSPSSLSGRNDNQIALELTGTRAGRTTRNVRGRPQTPV